MNLQLKQFCDDCFVHFERADATGRCPSCFSKECESCHTKPRLTRRTIAAFDYEENAEALVIAFKFGGRSYLAQGMGALMTLQWLEQGLPLPDLIIPIPGSPLATYQRGYSPSLLLAQTISSLMSRPLWNGLAKELTFLKQSQLNEKERLNLSQDHITLAKDPASLRDKYILLIDDVLTTGQTLNLSASCLLEGYPRAIDALVFARS